MFSNIKISHRMILGTILTMILISSVGYFGFKANSRIEAQSRIINASKSMVLNIVEGKELLGRYLSTDNLDAMGSIEKEMLGKNNIVNAWIKVLSSEQPNTVERSAITMDLSQSGISDQGNLLSDPAIQNIAKSIELSKNKLNEIYADLIKVHAEKIDLKNEFEVLYPQESDKRHAIKNIINKLDNLGLARGFGEVLYLSKESLFQYRDKDHIDKWLLSINNLKEEALSQNENDLTDLIDDYYSTAKIMGDIVLSISEKETIEDSKKISYDEGIDALNLEKERLNNAILSLSSKTVTNTNVLLLGIIFIAVILGILVSAIITHSITGPIKKLVVTAKKIAEGDLSSRVDISGNDEVSQFAKIFNEMVIKLQKANKEISVRLKSQETEILQSQELLRNQQKALVNVLEDVDQERKEAAEERDRVNTILEGIADGVIVVNKEMEVILFNKKAEELSGFSVDEVMNKKYDQNINFVREDNIKVKNDFIEIAIMSGESLVSAIKTFIIRKDKKMLPIDKSAAIIKDINGDVVACVVVFRDVTLERTIDKAKTEFVSLASHQLRTPLSSISWYTEMLLAGDAGKINKDQKEYLNEVYAGSRRMVDLVNSLLNVSRIELGTFAIEPKLMDLGAICDSLIKELIHDIKEKNIKVIKKIDKNTPKIIADPKLISIIFQNLLSNSVKYTLPGGTIKIIIEKDKTHVSLEFSDSGMGIPRNQQGLIFTKMFRADNVRMTDTEGTGLGLYIVKAIVENSGGSISFKSKEGKGTTFYIKLPIKGVEKREGSKELMPG